MENKLVAFIVDDSFVLDAEVVAENHLHGLAMQHPIGVIDMGEVNDGRVREGCLPVATQPEVGKVGHQHFEAHSSDARIHSLVLFHIHIRKYLIHKLFVDTAVRSARI